MLPQCPKKSSPSQRRRSVVVSSFLPDTAALDALERCKVAGVTWIHIPMGFYRVILGVYIPIKTIPIKGEMTIPNIGSLDPGTYVFFSKFFCVKVTSFFSVMLY